MKRNVGNWERAVRALAGVGMLVGAVVAPFSLLVRLALLGAGGIYTLGTALVGTCLGYKLIGRSTCPVPPREVARAVNS